MKPLSQSTQAGGCPGSNPTQRNEKCYGSKHNSHDNFLISPESLKNPTIILSQKKLTQTTAHTEIDLYRFGKKNTDSRVNTQGIGLSLHLKLDKQLKPRTTTILPKILMMHFPPKFLKIPMSLIIATPAKGRLKGKTTVGCFAQSSAR